MHSIEAHWQRRDYGALAPAAAGGTEREGTENKWKNIFVCILTVEIGPTKSEPKLNGRIAGLAMGCTKNLAGRD